MAAGLQVDKDYLNAKVGSIAVQIRDVLRSAENVTTTMSAFDHAGLVASFGFSEQDATDLMDALYALSLLAGVAHGTQAMPTATNLLVGLSKVTGLD